MESVRKDVECTFGILKNRWRILKLPILYRREKVIDAIMKTCCALHNMLLEYDDKFSMDSLERCKTYWEDMEPDSADDPVIRETEVSMELENYRQEAADSTTPIFPNSRATYKPGVDFILGNYDLKVEYLLTSFTRQWELGKIIWPRNFSSFQKLLLSCEMRTRNTLGRGVFYANKSSIELVVPRADGTRGIGEGLFSNVSWKKNDVLITFKGTIINKSMKIQREADKKGGYMIQINVDCFLDCYDNRWLASDHPDKCLASVANCHRKCQFVGTSTRATVNTRLKVDAASKKVAVVANTNVAAHVEILYDYGGAYKNYDVCDNMKSLL